MTENHLQLLIKDRLKNNIQPSIMRYSRDVFEIRSDFVRVTFPFNKPFEETAEGIEAQSRAQLGAQSQAQSIAILSTLVSGPYSTAEIAEALALETKTGAFKRAIKDLLAQQFIEYTLPDKPNSRLQKYRLTDKGRTLLDNIDKGH